MQHGWLSYREHVSPFSQQPSWPPSGSILFVSQRRTVATHLRYRDALKSKYARFIFPPVRTGTVRTFFSSGKSHPSNARDDVSVFSTAIIVGAFHPSGNLLRTALKRPSR